MHDATPATGPRLYTELAEWYPLLTAPSEYAEEAAFYTTTIREVARDARTVLELGCGGGNNASLLRADFEMTLTDLSPAMLEVSRHINPDCEHLLGDMRTLRLGRTFDVVFVHDAVMYLTDEADLRRTMDTAFSHAAAGGGVALFAPDCVRETFREGACHGGHDSGARALRYLEWLWDPDPNDTEYLADFVYVLRDGRSERPMRVEHDRHRFGLFPRHTWLRLLRDAGFRDVRCAPVPTGEDSPMTPELFVGVR